MNILIIETDKEYLFERVEDRIVELPQDWDCEYVNVVLWEEDICTQEGSKFTVNNCGELLLKRVKVEDDVNAIELEEYVGEDVLIVQI